MAVHEVVRIGEASCHALHYVARQRGMSLSEALEHLIRVAFDVASLKKLRSTTGPATRSASP